MPAYVLCAAATNPELMMAEVEHSKSFGSPGHTELLCVWLGEAIGGNVSTRYSDHGAEVTKALRFCTIHFSHGN